MLGLVSWEDIKEILDLDDEERDEDYLSGVKERAIYFYRNRPGFFTPYEGSTEFVGEVLALPLYPTAALGAAAIAAFTAAIAAVYVVGCVLLTLGAVVAMDADYRNLGMQKAYEALTLTGLSLLGTVAATMLAIVSIPHTIGSLFTRSVKSIIETEECCNNSNVIDVF